MAKYFGTDVFCGEAEITLTADHAYKVSCFLGWYIITLCVNTMVIPILLVSLSVKIHAAAPIWI